MGGNKLWDTGCSGQQFRKLLNDRMVCSKLQGHRKQRYHPPLREWINELQDSCFPTTASTTGYPSSWSSSRGDPSSWSSSTGDPQCEREETEEQKTKELSPPNDSANQKKKQKEKQGLRHFKF